MSNVCAGIGRGQMTVLEERVNKKRAIYKNYQTALNNISGISFQMEPENFYSNRWLTTILIDPAKTPNNITNEYLRVALDKNNIESRPLWKPMHLQPVFKDAAFYGDRTSDKLFQQGLCLPSGSNLTEEAIESVKSKISLAFTLQ
jgi:dTDP-4-amino-4,6-dideoxygalactose transaminase